MYRAVVIPVLFWRRAKNKEQRIKNFWEKLKARATYVVHCFLLPLVKNDPNWIALRGGIWETFGLKKGEKWRNSSQYNHMCVRLVQLHAKYFSFSLKVDGTHFTFLLFQYTHACMHVSWNKMDKYQKQKGKLDKQFGKKYFVHIRTYVCPRGKMNSRNFRWDDIPRKKRK